MDPEKALHKHPVARLVWITIGVAAGISLAHAQWSALLRPVLIGVPASRLYPGLVNHPVSWLERSPPSMFRGGWRD